MYLQPKKILGIIFQQSGSKIILINQEKVHVVWDLLQQDVNHTVSIIPSYCRQAFYLSNVKYVQRVCVGAVTMCTQETGRLIY